jgi:hypothetical protein
MDNGKTSIPSLYLVNPEKLSPHPLLTQYFPDGSDEERDDLKESIKTVGILHPIVAKKNGEIISGRQRWRAAKEAGLKSVPVRFMDFKQPEQGCHDSGQCVCALAVAERSGEEQGAVIGNLEAKRAWRIQGKGSCKPHSGSAESSQAAYRASRG